VPARLLNNVYPEEEMPDRLSLHAPTLVNTIGHAAGAIIFGILLYLLFLDWRRNPAAKGILPSVAAALALFWNLGSLVGLATDAQSGFLADFIIACSFSVLSFLPAVLLHLSAGDAKRLVLSGYILSACAAALHFADLVTGAARYHQAAVLLITVAFGALTIAVVVLRKAGGSKADSTRRLVGAMMLFLFAISFMHFGSNHAGHAWSGEIALHHAGIPLALFVLLQDYRFLLLDTFIRFLVNACLAASALTLAVLVGMRFDPIHELNSRPFDAALAFVAACLCLILFGYARRWVQTWITRALFLRKDREKTVLEIQKLAAQSIGEEAFLSESAKMVAGFIGCRQFEWGTDSGQAAEGWVEFALPAEFARGDQLWLRLGARRGGRPFLSEDLEDLNRLLLEVTRQVDRLRSVEVQSLLAKSELQALQAQINPHFLFNTLNTVYGSIARGNSQARSLILNLSDILRYSLSSERAFIPIEDELRIVRAYLEIEEARLGPRLHTEINVDEAAAGLSIPAFSIQPLVENAVKYGAASRGGRGYVQVTVERGEERFRISITNSGVYPGSPESRGNGVSLKNIQRRLAICYGEAAAFRIETDAGQTVVRFEVPAKTLAVRA
jgi:hypothetical protein